MLTDPIADMLTCLRNAQAVKKAEVSLVKSKIKLNLARILKQEGYIFDFHEKDRRLVIELKYHQGQPVIKEIKRISKPCQRIYSGHQKLFPYKNGLGVTIISTSVGIMTDKKARRVKVGGEIFCRIF